MPVFDIYPRRKKRALRAEPEVYQYDRVPETLRVQVRRIFEDSLGQYYNPRAGFYGGSTPNNNAAWDFIRDTVARELGRLSLANERDARADCIGFIHAEQDVDCWLALVEVGMHVIDGRLMWRMPAIERQRIGVKQEPDDAIDELNFRFREAEVGYQYENRRIIRVDSQFIHVEVVKPALVLLSDPRFKGAQEEFLAAHAHYRAGEYKDANVDTLNAFESTLKGICDAKGWAYPKGARAVDLINVVRANHLLPEYLDPSFDQLISTLKSGLTKVRNEAGGHGQGAMPKEVPAYLAAYALHLAAAMIVLLVEAFRSNK